MNIADVQTHEALRICTPTNGYRDEIVISCSDMKTSAALTLTGATAPTITVSANQTLLTWTAGTVTPVMFACGMPIPRHVSDIEIDPVTKRHGVNMAVDFWALCGGSTDAQTITAEIYTKSSGGAIKGPFTATATAISNATVAPNVTRYRASFTGLQDASGNRINSGDVISSGTFTPGTHATDNLTLYGASLVYERQISTQNVTERFSAV